MNAADIAAKSSLKARAAINGKWPRYSYSLHSTHIRWFKRNRLIEQHNATDYRLTPLGLAVRAILQAKEPTDESDPKP